MLGFLRVQLSWREIFRRITEFSDGQIRFFALSSMLVGVLILLLFGGG